MGSQNPGLIDPKGKPLSTKPAKPQPRMVATYELSLAPKQMLELPATSNPEDNPTFLAITTASKGERAVIMHSGAVPVMRASVIMTKPEVIAKVTLYCIQGGEQIPEGTFYVGTVSIGERDYHYFT